MSHSCPALLWCLDLLRTPVLTEGLVPFCATVLGLRGEGLVLGAAGVVSVSRAQQLPHGRSEPAPDGSKRHPPLARAEPVSDAGWASGRADFRALKGEVGGGQWV